MGLADRLKASRQREEEQAAAFAEASQKAAQTAESDNLTSAQQRLAEHYRISEAMIVKFSRIAEVIGVKQHLEEVQKVWPGGIITQPHLGYIELVDYNNVAREHIPGRVDFGISFSYCDLKELYTDEHSGEDSWYARHTGSQVQQTRTELGITIGHLRGIDQPPLASTYYGNAGRSRIYQNGQPAEIPPYTIRLSDVAEANKALEDQLFRLIQDATNRHDAPSDLAKAGRARIIADRFIPQKTKHECFPDLRAALPWYRKIF